ncbi:hypothetical protein BLOT_006144 [Blomia tropicalis]|nr:hypothetical protein BLOT_006144 [Blomia tropicalis]
MNKMATQTTGITSLLNYAFYDYWEEAWDPRSRHLAFVDGGPLKMLSAMTAYVVFCGWDRSGIDEKSKTIRIAYTNVDLQCDQCGCKHLLLHHFPQHDPKAVTEVDLIKVRLVFIYILTKLFDLLDTFFFVLRKKNSQISEKRNLDTVRI